MSSAEPEDVAVAGRHIAVAQSPAVGVGGEVGACLNQSSDLAGTEKFDVADHTAGV